MDLKQKLINLVCKPTPTSLTMPTARWSSMLDEAPQTAGPTSFQVRLRRVVSVVALSGLSLGLLLRVVLTIHPQMPSVTLATACGQTLKQSATSTLLLAVPMPLPNGSRQFNQTSHC